MNASKNSVKEEAEKPLSLEGVEQAVLYKGKMLKVSEAVQKIITDKSGTKLFSDNLSRKEKILKLIDPETQEKIELTGSQIAEGFHNGILSFMRGVSTIQQTTDLLKNASDKGLPSQIFKTEEKNTLSKKKKSFNKEKRDLLTCPHCGAEVTTQEIESIREENNTKSKKKYTIKCSACGKKILMLRNQPAKA